ncbi:MAG: hypothetical protein ABIT01_15145 [Thermoanaerobaculia bacterium]
MPLATVTRSPEAGAERTDAALAEADLLWSRRSDGATGVQAIPGPVDALIAACRQIISHEPASLEARWRLMRALYFKGEYTTEDPTQKKNIFDAGRVVGDEALAIVRRVAPLAKPRPNATPVDLAPVVKGQRAVIACFYWAAVDWGKWALAFGKSAAVKQGAAAKIRDYAAAVIALDPSFEEGGGYRVLGRLHHQTPSVPFFTGWASREEAMKNLRLANRAGSRNFFNRLYLAEAMWDYEKTKRPESRAMLESLTADTPSAEFPVEDRKTQAEAKALLASWTAR